MPFQVPIRRGEDHPFAKISNAERSDCRRRWEAGARVKDLAAEMGMDPSRMSQIVRHPEKYQNLTREARVDRSKAGEPSEGPG